MAHNASGRSRVDLSLLAVAALSIVVLVALAVWSRL